MRRTDTNEFGEVEYDLDYSPPTSKRESLECQYVLPESKPKTDLKNAPEKISQPVQPKKVVQDIYDEDHYTLARPSSNSSFEAIKNPKTEDDNFSKEHDGICTIFKKKKIFIFICIFLVLCIGGAVAAYLTLGNEKAITDKTNVEKGKRFKCNISILLLL